MSPKKWNAIYTIETLPASATYRTTIYTVSQGNNISPALFPLLRDRKNLCILISSPKNFFFHSNVSSLQLDSFFSATNVIIIIYFSMAVRLAGPVKTVVESIDRGGKVLTFGTLNRRVWGGEEGAELTSVQIVP